MRALDSISLPEQAAPSTPPSGFAAVYAKSDGKLYRKDDAGVEVELGGAGGPALYMWDGADYVELDRAFIGAANPDTEGFTEAAGDGWYQPGSIPTASRLSYVPFTSTVSPTATTEATANTVVTADPLTFDGATQIEIEFYSPTARPDSGAVGRTLDFWLYDGSSSIGKVASLITPAASQMRVPVNIKVLLIPSAGSHTFSIRASVSAGTGLIDAGVGGAATTRPGFISVKVDAASVGFSAYSAYTPVITQNGARTTSALVARYVKFGRMVNCSGYAAISNAGTAGNALTVSLPIPAATTSGIIIGSGMFYDASADDTYALVVAADTSTTIKFYTSSTTGGTAFGVNPSLAVANTDFLSWEATYEATY